MLRLLSDIIPMLILYSWRKFRLLSSVLSGWISIMTVKAYWCNLFHEVIDIQRDKDYIVSIHERQVAQEQLLREINDINTPSLSL